MAKSKDKTKKNNATKTRNFTIDRSNNNKDDKDLYGFGETNCHCCGLSNTDVGGFLLQCNACKNAYYCSINCFNNDLEKHMQFCQATELKKGPKGRKRIKPQPTVSDSTNTDGSGTEIKRAYVGDSCTESDTDATGSLALSHKNASTTINYTKKGDTMMEEDSESESEEDNSLLKPPGSLTRPKSTKRVFNDGGCSESETEAENDTVVGRSWAMARVKKSRATQDIPTVLDFSLNPTAFESDSEEDSEEWETDYSSSSQSESLSRDASTLDVVLEDSENESVEESTDDTTREDRTASRLSDRAIVVPTRSNSEISLCSEMTSSVVRSSRRRERRGGKRPGKSKSSTTECMTEANVSGRVLCYDRSIVSADTAAKRPQRTISGNKESGCSVASMANGKSNGLRRLKSDSPDSSSSDCSSEDSSDSSIQKQTRRVRKVKSFKRATTTKARRRKEFVDSDDDESCVLFLGKKKAKKIQRWKSESDDDDSSSDDSHVLGEKKARKVKRWNSDDDESSSEERLEDEDDNRKPSHDEKSRMKTRLTNLWTLPESPTKDVDPSKRRALRMSNSMLREGPRMNSCLGKLWTLPGVATKNENVTGDQPNMANDIAFVVGAELVNRDDGESDDEERRMRSGGGRVYIDESWEDTSGSEDGVTLRETETVRRAIRPLKKEWSESQLRTTTQGEELKKEGDLSRTPNTPSELEPDWLRHCALRPTMKGEKLRRQESIRAIRMGETSQQHPGENDSSPQTPGFVSQTKLRPTMKGRMLARGQSIREKYNAPTADVGSVKNADGSVGSTYSRTPVPRTRSIRVKKQRSIRSNASNSSFRSNASSGSGTSQPARRRPPPARSSGLSRTSSNGSSSVDAGSVMMPSTIRRTLSRKSSRKEGRGNISSHGSFRVKRGNVAITLNVVKLEKEQPVAGMRRVLRSTSRGAMLKREGSLRKGTAQPESAAHAAEQSILSDIESSASQLEETVGEMGFTIEDIAEES